MHILFGTIPAKPITDQAAQMASILNDFAKYYQTVLSDGKARILNILNDEQRRKFEKMLKERPPS